MGELAPTARHRPEAGVLARRLGSLHRAAQEQARAGRGGARLSDRQRGKWETLLRDHGGRGRREPPGSWDRAVDSASRWFTAEAQREQDARSHAWRKQFATWSSDVLKRGAGLVRQPAGQPAFSAADMREEWRPRWCPEGVDGAALRRNWRQAALAAGMVPAQRRRWTPPCFDEFLGALRTVHGAHGLDGWTVGELQQLAAHAPEVMRELYELLVRTTRQATPEQFMSEQLRWRVVGIPKRRPRQPSDSRRADHRECLEQGVGAVPPPDPTGAVERSRRGGRNRRLACSAGPRRSRGRSGQGL